MQITQANIQSRGLSPEDVRTVAPALEAYTQELLYGDVWKRPGLTPRDRSLITIAALIARDQSPALPYYLNQAIENGVKPREISETIMHLAFYAGWANASRPLAPRDVFGKRGVGADQLPSASVEGRSTRPRRPIVRRGEQFGTVSPGSSNTPQTCCSGISGTSRSGARDRSLVTERPDRRTGRAAAHHLNRAMDSDRRSPKPPRSHLLGLLHGWPSVLGSAGGKGRFEKRTR